MLENSMPKLHKEIRGRGKTKIYCHGTICQKQVVAVLQAIKLGITEAGNKAKPLQYSGGGELHLYQFRADVQTYSGHRPQYTASNAAETDVCTQKCQVTV
jgi:hypothetical protein